MTEKYIARSWAVAARMLGGEMMIMSADSTLFTLNRQATIIWNAADGVTPLREIVEREICGVFEVDPAVAYQDAEDLVRDLAGHGILILSGQPAVGRETAP
jgi:hypothetical protein